ncbi:MAG: hypothetical protein HY791_00600 [Deltaproteobacteria bacterium]|nr:hypothetical protein [Deltaproteobacteria bacterium]
MSPVTPSLSRGLANLPFDKLRVAGTKSGDQSRPAIAIVAWCREFKRSNRRAFARVLRKAEPGLEPRREDFIETEILELAPLPAGVDAQEIEREVAEEEKRLRGKKPHVLGRDAILAQPFDGQPKKTDRSWRPL